MAKRFFFTQYSEAASNAAYIVEIYDEDFTGTAIAIEGWFTLKYDEAQISDILRAVLPSYAEINVNVNEGDDEFEEFLNEIPGADEERFIVKIFRDSVQIWTGQVPTDLVEVPDDFYTYQVTISAICGLARLKNIPYDNNGTAYSGRNTILGHLLQALSKANYPTLLGFAPLLQVSVLNWNEDNLLKSNSGLEAIDLTYDVFQEYNEFGEIEGRSCYDVIEMICRQFHYRLFMYGDCFFAQHINDNNAAFIYKYSLNGTVLSTTNVDYRLNFSTERESGNYSFYPAVRQISLLYQYKVGVNKGNLLPPDYELGTSQSIGNFAGDANEILKVILNGTIRIYIDQDEAFFVRYHLTLQVGTKYLVGVQSNIAGNTPGTWSSTPGVFVIDIGPYITVQSQPIDIEILTPPIDPGGAGTFKLEYYDTYKNLTTPVVLDPGTYSINFSNIQCRLLVNDDQAANGKIKFVAINTIDGTTPIKSRFDEELPPTEIGDGPLIYNAGRLRVYDGSDWQSSESWQHATGGTKMNINKLRLQEALALKKDRVQAFDFTLLKYCAIYNYLMFNTTDRLLTLGYELDPDLDTVTLNTVYYKTDRTNIVINSEIDAPANGSTNNGGGSYGGSNPVYWKREDNILIPIDEANELNIKADAQFDGSTNFGDVENGEYALIDKSGLVKLYGDARYYRRDNVIHTDPLEEGSQGTAGDILISNGAGSAPYFANTSQALPSHLKKLFVQTADRTISNTTTETSLFTTGIGSKDIAAGSLSAGRAIRTTIHGLISTASGEGESITIKVKLSGTAIITITGDLPSGFTSNILRLELFITCRSLGSSGTVKVNGNIIMEHRSAGYNILIPLTSSGVTTVNTNNQITYDITATWASAKAGNSLITNHAIVEQI